MLQMREHESRHVARGGRCATGCRRCYQLIMLGGLGSIPVAERSLPLEALGQRLLECRMRHPQRAQDVIVDIARVRLAADSLDNITGERGTVVGVRRNRPGGKQQGTRMLFQIDFLRLQPLGIQGKDVLETLLKAAAVIHQIQQRDGLAAGRGDFEIQVVIDIAIQIELALLHQLHDRGPRKQLGRGADPGQDLLGVHGNLAGHIGVAVAGLEKDFAVFDDDDHGPGDIAVLEPVAHQPIAATPPHREH